MEDNSTWKSVINLKYGSRNGSWFPSIPTGCHGVGLWKEISKEGMLLRHHCSMKDRGWFQGEILGRLVVW